MVQAKGRLPATMTAREETAISNEPARKPRPRLHLLYHELRAVPGNYSYVLASSEFARHMELCAEMRRQDRAAVYPEVTFDDGHISSYQEARPILQAWGVRASFFITVGWTGQKPGYMGWAEVRALHQDGHGIGAHGMTHTLLTHCSGKDLHTELEVSRHTLEDKLGAPITAMSLPGGRFNRRVLAACAEAGYTRVYTSVPQLEPEPLGFAVGRLNVRQQMTADWVARLLQPGSRELARLRRQYLWKQSAKAVLGDRLYARLWAIANREEPAMREGE